MKLRPRQQEFVRKTLWAIAECGETLGVAPTGAGKTVMLSSTIHLLMDKTPGMRTLVIQHRDELVAQNRATFKRVSPNTPSDIYAADRKRWSEGATFAMVQTLSRPDNLETMPKMDLIVIDEAHHVAAVSYRSILDRARELNPDLKVLGVTATPQRGDKKALKEVFSNVSDVITVKELIEAGNLVRPRVFVIDCGLRQELASVRRTIADFDMDAVAAIMDKSAVNERVIEEWKAKAGDRKTVLFCSTVEHAEHVTEALKEAGVKADIVHGNLSDHARRKVLHGFEHDHFQVLVNVAVLTEGWDCQTVSCVVLLRPCSFKSTMIQMIGRGLRKVDPERYPGVIKTDCIVMDFGYSLLTHGGIETEVKLEPVAAGEPMVKTCPSCGMEVPAPLAVCPACEHIFDAVERRFKEASEDREDLVNFTLTEVEIFEMSPFRWETFWDGMVTMANAMTAWTVVVRHDDKEWVVGGLDDSASVKLIGVTTDRLQAIASADDYLREHGDKDAARKSKRWLHEPPSNKQLDILGLTPLSAMGLTKYKASCLLTWKFRERAIKAKVLAI
ncbi:SSL2 DNA or RNA helicases of superfamily II [uncultured Caudovirales phage]|uniref:SSL2 DNA or RNA helicases of superfamily II n=1 Tax=uncultured Caudovirales phage TaxID=2100421 RepID=A0A6J5MVU3_9CAUD|nr:SSL2 DNA or RNA helicases of superfamily II [uncultured Caudovirales phage]